MTPAIDWALSDLHRHLDGSLRASTLRDLADDHGVALPESMVFQPGMGLEAALACFATTLSVLQQPEAVRRVASEMCEDAAAEGVTTLEIRFAPQLHEGAAMDAIVAAAVDGAAGRAGVLLCALYGDPPELVERLVSVAAANDGVVGIDLAGGPSGGHSWRLEDYGPAFRRARKLGLGRTVHAGEGRPAGEIRMAIEQLAAQRIGHGASLLDDHAVLELVLERGVTIEACPTSNVHTGVFENVEAHPIARWLDCGVKVAVCSDNTLLSAVDAPTELLRVAAIDGMNEERLRLVSKHGHAAAFRR
jgi:adenosine deaminase